MLPLHLLCVSRVCIDEGADYIFVVLQNLIGLLAKLACSSLVAVKALFELNVGSTIRGILVSSDLSHGMPYLPSENQNNQVGCVIASLFPGHLSIILYLAVSTSCGPEPIYICHLTSVRSS